MVRFLEEEETGLPAKTGGCCKRAETWKQPLRSAYGTIDSVPAPCQFLDGYLWRRLSSRQSLNVRSYPLRVLLAAVLSRAVPRTFASSPHHDNRQPAHASPQPWNSACQPASRVPILRDHTLRLPLRSQCHSKHRLCNPNRRSFHLPTCARRLVFDCAHTAHRTLKERLHARQSLNTTQSLESRPLATRNLAADARILRHHASAGHPLIDSILHRLLSAATLDAVDAHHSGDSHCYLSRHQLRRARVLPKWTVRRAHDRVRHWYVASHRALRHVRPRTNTYIEELFKGQPTPDFSLPASSRHALSSILIVHPVAALMTLICFGLAVAAHFHSPAHSPRYLLALLIFTFPTLLVSLLAFLVDILLFVPHVAWGGWIVLAATIIIVASGIVTCAMRRTLVSRKARKKRIAENEDMNGQTYYANRANTTTVQTDFPKAESPPPFAGDVMSNPQGNDFASFDLRKQNSPEDMTPLNQRNPSLKTVSSGGNGSDSMAPVQRGPSGRGRQPIDQYGNPVPPMPNDGMMMMNSPPRGPPGPGRGGPSGPGGPYRGRGGPRGGPYGGRGRGGFGPPPGGMRGPPPPGWNGGGRGMRPPQGAPMNGPGPGPGRGGPPPGYNNNYYGPGPGGPGGPPPREISPYSNRGPPPPGPMSMPIGQAIEMDNRTGTPPVNGNQNYGLRESDGDVQGMLALQQGGFPADAPQRRPSNGNGLLSPTSEYSTE
jgi:hypothetical protein